MDPTVRGEELQHPANCCLGANTSDGFSSRALSISLKDAEGLHQESVGMMIKDQPGGTAQDPVVEPTKDSHGSCLGGKQHP